MLLYRDIAGSGADIRKVHAHVTSLNLECNILTRTPERFDVITIVAMFAIVATPNTIVAKNHNCCNSNHNCRIFDLPQLS